MSVGCAAAPRGAASRLARGARLLQIAVPPDVQDTGGPLLWSALHDLLRPRLARLLDGQPQLAWEIAPSEAGTTSASGSRRVPPGLIERALASAWPGISASTEPVAPDEPDTAYPRAEDGAPHFRARALRAGWFPLVRRESRSAAARSRPARWLIDAEQALVQVVARPASSREQRRLRTAARRIRAGVPTCRALRLLERATRPPPTRPTARSDGQPRTCGR